MRGKGLVIFFSLALIIITLYQLSFNIVTRRVERQARQFAEQSVLKGIPIGQANDSLVALVRQKEQYFLDSISNKNIYNIGIARFTYQECKDQQLNLGLDLQGGMNVILEVALDELILSLAEYSTDETFRKALALARQKRTEQPQAEFVTLFAQAWNEVDPNARMASVFATRNNQEFVKLTSTNEEVIAFLRQEAESAFSRTFNIIRSRIDNFGVTQPSITAQPGTGRIIVELPGVSNPARVRKLLQATAVLEFWETYDNRVFYNYMVAANNVLRNRLAPADTAAEPQSPTEAEQNPLLSAGDTAVADTARKETDVFAAADTSLAVAEEDEAADRARFRRENPLFAILQVPFYVDETDNSQKIAPGPVVGWVDGKDTAQVNRYLSLDFVRAVFPRDVRFAWSAKPMDENSNIFMLYALQKQKGTDRAPIEGDKIISARQDVDQNGNPEVTMIMNSEGARIWKSLTAKQIGKYGKNERGEDQNGAIAIVLDNLVYSAPTVISEIPSGRSSISGGFTIEEAQDLANILQAGKLPAPARIIAESVVGPSLGQESIRAGLRSVILAFIATLLFMVLYYNTSGIVANIALFFNLVFILGVLASLGATLTLPGIAGIVLTMGMAVDANILIHERIKEELRKGKNLVKAIHDGHVNSYSAVFDTHLTVLITGLILAYFGLGPVLGYATTLNIGVIMTLFTAVFMAQLIFHWWVKDGSRPIHFTTFLSKIDLSRFNIQFVAKRKYAYIISSVLAVVGLVSIFSKGFEYGVDFTGGRSFVIKFDQRVSADDVRAALTQKFDGATPQVKTYGTDDKLKITTQYLINESSPATDSIVNARLYEGLLPFYKQPVSYDQFLSQFQLSSQVVGPSISTDILNHAYMAVTFALIGIFLYILFRFRKWQFALGAIIALIHDVLMVMGAYSLLSGIVPFTLEIDEAFVAAMLTVIGYSVADTVIVFDRIREFLREHPHAEMKKTINDAINHTLNRTLITSVTIILVLLVLFLFGGDAIRGFSFALLMGVCVGTYSSIYVATPIVIDLATKKKIEPATGRKPLVAKA
ncbi:MAG: protein translocase subunit SecDF [Chitinophagales bacterium]|nr:protein translocase subunit SecDF [Chitinophagales bacterium]MDW8428011.1 protein translocase subunit SecDF [Chitinophagales bacterium]